MLLYLTFIGASRNQVFKNIKLKKVKEAKERNVSS